MSSQGILERILHHKRFEIEKAKKQKPLSTVRAMAEETGVSKRSLVDALSKETKRPLPYVIAECKKRSPSKGLLRADFDALSLASAYERAGAAAISVLTDEEFFGGSLADLRAVSGSVGIPVLRKDFIVDEYQIFEARLHGADSFLLLAGVLDTAQLQYFTEIGRDLGMEPLVETHSAEQLRAALGTDAKIIGINNRNLQTMEVSLQHSFDLLSAMKVELKTRLLVCESGVGSFDAMQQAGKAGFHACLIGESLVTSDNPEQALVDLQRGS